MSDERERRRSDGGRPAPNVKPKLHQSAKEEQRRKVRRSRSIDSDRGRRRERHHQEERRHRGRSEESRRRPRRDGESERRRATPPEDEEDAECAVCFCSYDNVFKTPKLLACGHTFCLECLARINVASPELKTLTCPVCRELTELPHGQDLPRLDTNQDIIGRLPPDMQRAISIRFKRSKGKLLLKHPPPSSPTKPSVLALPVKSPTQAQAAGTSGGHLGLSEMEQGAPQATVVDVGQPPSRVRSRLRRLYRSDRCYYAVVGSIISITVALMLVGILAFVIIPRVGIPNPRPPGQNNQTGPP